MRNLYVVECRNPDGKLDFTGPQPESVFGSSCVTGISSDAIAKTVFRFKPDAVMCGDSISTWTKNIDPRWTARVKTW